MHDSIPSSLASTTNVISHNKKKTDRNEACLWGGMETAAVLLPFPRLDCYRWKSGPLSALKSLFFLFMSLRRTYRRVRGCLLSFFINGLLVQYVFFCMLRRPWLSSISLSFFFISITLLSVGLYERLCNHRETFIAFIRNV